GKILCALSLKGLYVCMPYLSKGFFVCVPYVIPKGFVVCVPYVFPKGLTSVSTVDLLLSLQSKTFF
ncbi:hypothetical protein, partial [Klebsiella pneumoniae]|uniref:hypothetical protein n=1 Tax=Klebsiella pneumoniae TaxID=573 RepID=UPI002731C589